MEDIVAENAELRDIQMQALRNQAEKVSDNAAGLAGPINAEIVAEMNDRIDILMAENAALVDQKGSLTMEMEQLQNELTARTSEVAVLSERLSSTTTDLKTCAMQGVQVEKERDEAAKEAVSMSDALGRMDGEMNNLREELIMWQQKCTDAETTISDMKKEVSNAVDHSNSSALASMRRVKASEDRMKEVQAHMTKKTVELENALELNRKLKREYQSTRQDAEGMLQVMSGLERQINEYSGREAEVEARERKAREEVEASLTERDRAVARADQNKLEIERLLAERKKFQEERLVQIEAAVDAARARSTEQIRTCESEMTSLAEAMSKLQMDTEKAIREGKAARELLNSKERLHEDDRRNFKESLKDSRDRLAVAIIARDEEASKKVDIQEANKELRGVIDKLRLDIDSMQIQVNATERARLAEVSSLKTSNRDLAKDVTEKQRLLTRKNLEIEEIKEDYEDKLKRVEKQLEDEVKLLRTRTTEAEKIAQDVESNSEKENGRMVSLLDQIKEKGEGQVRALEQQLRTDAEVLKKMAIKTRELESANENLVEEKNMLVVVVEDARNSINELQEDLITAKDTILDLTESLSESHAAREEASRRAASILEHINGDEPKKGHRKVKHYSEEKGQ